jgi:hypothetical protein
MSYYRTDEKAALEAAQGATVEALWVSNDGEHEMRIVTDKGTLSLPTEGDCCSESWWADAFGVRQLLGAVITSVNDIDMPEVTDDRSRQECDQAYGIQITTDRGVCDLVFRNSSNGYYGGWCNPRWEEGVQRTEPVSYRQITEDWSA